MFTGRGKQLTIFISETDHYHHQALYMAIIEMLRREGCSGATATRGVAGFGASALIHTAAILRRLYTCLRAEKRLVHEQGGCPTALPIVDFFPSLATCVVGHILMCP